MLTHSIEQGKVLHFVESCSVVEVRVGWGRHVFFWRDPVNRISGVIQKDRLVRLGQANDAASDGKALALSITALAAITRVVLGLVDVIFSFVDDHGTADHTVGSAESHKRIPLSVLSLVIKSGLDLLDITYATLMNIISALSMIGTKGVENVANR